MTEKRFGYVTEELCYGVTDNGKFLSPIDCMHLLNALHEENQELRADNDIKFWKRQCMTQHNSTQIILHELSLAMDDGYEVSDRFKDWLDELKEKNRRVRDKHKRLFE